MAAYIKAILGSAIAGLSSLVTALEDGGVSLQEGLIAAIAALTALGVVYAVPNRET